MTSFAKITAPKPVALLARRRLFRQLDALQVQGALWITGPPGAGKTSLVTSYLHERKRPHVWYQVDSGDGDPATFFYYLGLAAKKAKPGRKKLLPLLTPEYLQDIPTFTRRYFEQFFSRLGAGTCVVFDNYQEAPAEALVHQIVRDGLSVLPEGITVFLLSRRMPPALFARQRAHEKLAVLGWEELRLRLDETGAMVRARAGKKIPIRIVEELHQAVDGWPAGLTMLIEQIKVKGVDAARVSQRPAEEVFNYFADEVFDRAEGALQQLLLKTAFLPKITVQNAQALSGLKKAGNELERLSKAGYFTTRHAGAEAMYEYHPLFRSFLKERARKHYRAEKYKSLLTQAAELLEASGQAEAAVELLQEAGDWQGLIGLILKQAPFMLAQGRSQTLQEWLGSIPAAITERTPWLLYWNGACTLHVAPAESRAYFEKAFKLFEGREDLTGTLLSWSGAVDTFSLEYDDFKPLDTWINWLEMRIGQGLSYPSIEVEARVVSSMTGALIWRRPDPQNVGQWMDRSFQFVKNNFPNQQQYLQSFQHAAYYLFMGRLSDCHIFIDEVKQKTSLQTLSPLESINIKLIDAAIHEATAESDLAVKLVEKCFAMAEQAGVHLLNPALYAHGVYCALCMGDAETAKRHLQACEKSIGSNCRLHSAQYFHIAAWYHQLIGDFRQAAMLATRALESVQEAGTPLPETFIALNQALALYESGEKERARQRLGAIKEMNRKIKSAFVDFFCLMAEAYFAFEDLEEQEGLEALRNAMRCGRENDYIALHNFWRFDIIKRICSKALEHHIETGYVRKMIRKLHLAPDEQSAHLEDWPWEIRIRTLGRFEILRDGRPVAFAAKAPRKILSLLKALIACGGNGASEEQTADLLWPEAEGDTALQTLATSLHRLRQLLGNEHAIQIREGQIRFDPRICWIDAHVFENLASRSEELLQETRSTGKMATGPDALERAVNLYRGSFLQGAAEVWAVSYRERLRVKFLRTLEWLGEHLERAGRPAEAMNLYERGLETDPLGESLYRRIMRCCLAMGRKSEAVQAYQRCRGMLQSNLGVSPSPETEGLLRQAKPGMN